VLVDVNPELDYAIELLDPERFPQNRNRTDLKNPI
jgi:hypothetical protein